MADVRNTKERIAQHAYRIWEQEGRPHGKHLEHWIRAEREVGAEQPGGPRAAGPSAPMSRPSPPPAAQPTSREAQPSAPATKKPQAPRKKAGKTSEA